MANNQQEQSGTLLQQLAAVSSERDYAPHEQQQVGRQQQQPIQQQQQAGQQQQPRPTQQFGTQQLARSQVNRPGTKNYSNDEVMSMLQCIHSMLLLVKDMCQVVTDLHANNFLHGNHDANSIQRKYLKLANERPGSVNPAMSRVMLLAKEIKEAINVKAGVSNSDLSNFFWR
jgi:hypothetical protein